MRIGADQCVGIVHTITMVNTARQVFQIDLVNNTETGRDHAKSIKRLHAPFHELVAFIIALEFQLHVQIKRILFAEMIDLY